MVAVSYDLRVKARTPGQPDVLALTNVTTAAAGKLVERLKKHNLIAEFQILEHEQRVSTTTDERNAANHEVLIAVLEYREAKALAEAAAAVTG